MPRLATERRLFVSLGTRLAIPVVLLVAAAAAGAYLGLVKASRVTALSSKEAAVDMVVKLSALSVMPAVVFDDEIEMSRALDDLARNPEVTDIELWGVNSEGAISETPLACRHRKEGHAFGRPASARPERARDGRSIRAVEPIKSPEGKTVGTLAVRMSTARESAALANLSRQVLWVSFITALCLATAISVVLKRMVVGPLQELEQAARGLALGAEREHLVAFQRGTRFDDEVMRLSSTFGDMADAVRDREARLALRNHELQLILNSVGQGFLTARPDGTLLDERSAILSTWLGPLAEEATVGDVVERIHPASRAWMESAWQQVFEGIFPLEVALDQLPKRLTRDNRHFEFAYFPVQKGEHLEQIVLMVTDVTAEVEHQKALAEQHEFSTLVDQFVRDRRGFYEFWSEASALTHRLVGAQGVAESTRRDLHTLKGNARFCGLTRLAAHCHALESAMQERNDPALTGEERAALGELWNSLRSRIEPLMKGSSAFLEVSKEEYAGLLAAVRRREPAERLEEIVHGLRHESTAWRLNRARETLLSTCERLGKSAPKVTVAHHDLRLPPGRFAPFWSVFSHVVTNAADHGLEHDDERLAAGKPLPSEVTFSTSLIRDELVIVISDDGRGIDWEGTRTAAAARGMPHGSPKELAFALMTEGFSLRHKVSDLSGRGVGLAAVRAVVVDLGGKIEIESQRGRGTTWRFRLPAGALEEAVPLPLSDPATSIRSSLGLVTSHSSASAPLTEFALDH